MILTCPNCGTQYAVKDGAIPPQGRQVRCAACKHSWHQDPEEGSAPADEQPEAEAAMTAAIPAEEVPQVEVPDASDPADEDEESLAEATLIEPRSGPEAEERAYEEAMAEESHGPPVAEQGAEPAPVAETPDERDEFSPFAYRDEEGGERGRSKLWPILIAVIVIVIAAALFWFLAPPEWKTRVGLGGGMSPLALVTTHMDRQRLESGNELLTVSGRVINPTAKDQSVPPLQAQLKSRTGKLVYSWTIAPPARTLPPGASASFNSAEVNVPPGGDELTITVGTGSS
jgi:predicted Zn finger-like uncharacterized protein